MGKHISTIILTFLFLTNFSQTGVIVGFVYDGQTNKRLKSASINLVQKKLWTQTDQNGIFKFTGLPKGSYTIDFDYIGNGDTTINNITIDNNISDTIKVDLRYCCCVKFGEEPQCPICKKADMTIPIKYGKPSRRDIRKSKAGQLYLLEKPSHCNPRNFCRRDSIIYDS